jgi:hypothetical protein
MSFGEIEYKSPSEPSIRTRGAAFEPEPIVPIPRIFILIRLLREPPELPTLKFKPGTSPCNA